MRPLPKVATMIVDGGIMAVEQRNGGNDTNFMLRLVGSDLRHEITPLCNLGIEWYEDYSTGVGMFQSCLVIRFKFRKHDCYDIVQRG